MKSKNTTFIYICIALIAVFTVFITALLIGKFPITPASLLAGDTMAVRVFLNLRLPRCLMALFGGFGLGVSGFVYQTVFRNPLASPDIAGVSSGACVGAAFGILFISSTMFSVTICAFVGGLSAMALTLALSMLASGQNKTSIVLSGIAIHSLAQTVLMMLKLMADPEKQLASIEYWIMGSFSSTTLEKIPMSIFLICIGSLLLFLLHRQLMLLSVEDAEAKMLGISVGRLQILVLITATFIVAAVISVSGLISFVGLLAPHIARLLLNHNRPSAMMLSGLVGSILLLLSDIFAKSIASTELPISIFTSFIGAPFFIYLIVSRKRGVLR